MINVTPSENYLETITEVYCFASSDENGEGIIGQTVHMQGREVFMPFVCADIARVNSMRQMAQTISQESGKTIKLVKFTHRELIEVIKPLE